jgi:hypothetical protein
MLNAASPWTDSGEDDRGSDMRWILVPRGARLLSTPPFK